MTIGSTFLLLLAAVLAGAEPFDYSCLPGLSGPSLGVSLPRGDIEVELGSRPFPLYCHLNPEHSYYADGGYNASSLEFHTNQSLAGAEAINETTIVIQFDPAEPGITNVNCMLRTKDSRKKGICNQKIYVGYKPAPVEKFTCISEDWQSLNCTWDEPNNPVRTKYSLMYKEPGRRKPYWMCPSQSDLEMLLKKHLPDSLHSCYVDLKTHPPYRQTVKSLTFFFNATNSLNPAGNISIIKVEDHFAVVRPGRPRSLSLSAVSGSALALNYSVSNNLHHFPPGIIHSVRYTSEYDGENEWTEVDTSHLDIKAEHFELSIKGLPYPWANYTVEVRMVSAAADPSNVRLWSPPADVSARTTAVVPDRPETHPASFEVVGGLEDRTIYVYWKQVERSAQNGPEFRYVVTSVKEDGVVVPILASRVANAYAEFDGLSLQNYTFFTSAENSVGRAAGTSSVFVASSDLLKNIQPRSFTKTDLGNRNFELVWRPPASAHLVKSYTVFWCLADNNRDRPYQCDGRLAWEDVENTKPEDSKYFNFNLELPTSGVYQLAVAANTGSYSSGMVWATCTILKGKVVSKLKEVAVSFVTHNSAQVQWRLDCSDRVGVVKGYKVEFCSVASPSPSSECVEGSKRTVLVGPDAEQATLVNLQGWTYYKIGVRVETKAGSGELSDPLVNRTMASAPGSGPAGLRVKEIGLGFATLTWQLPQVPNGPIALYKLQYSYKRTQGGEPVRRRLEVFGTMANLTDLQSYTRYSVEVLACSQLENKHLACSQSVTQTFFTTRVGPPQTPPLPDVTFINATMVDVRINTKFSWGAESVSRWEVSVSRTKAEEWGENYTLSMEGSQLVKRISLDELSQEAGWSPDCSNSSNSNMFNFSVRASVREPNSGLLYESPWSSPRTLPAYCKPAFPWKIALAVGIAVPTIVLLTLVFICRAGNWIKRKQEFFSKLGKELDLKMTLAGDHGRPVPPEFNMSQLGQQQQQQQVGGGSDRPGHNRADSGGSTEKLLNEGGKMQHLSGQSDTTSGCESGRSSDAGSTPDRSPNIDHADNRCQSVDMGVRNDSYVMVGLPGASHYTRLTPQQSMMAPTPTMDPFPPGYSRVGRLDDSQLHLPGNAVDVGYVNTGGLALGQPHVDSSVAAVAAKPSTGGYVSLSSIKPGESQQAKSDGGYITIRQIKPATLEAPTSPQPAYSKVGLSGSDDAFGYLPNLSHGRQQSSSSPGGSVVVCPKGLPAQDGSSQPEVVARINDGKSHYATMV